MLNEIKTAKLQDILTTGTKPLEPRLTVVLYPNTAFIEIQLNDRVFNHVEYFSLFDIEDHPKLTGLYKYITSYPALDQCEISKSVIRLKLTESGLPCEVVPRALFGICEWAGDDYNPTICVLDKRWLVEHRDDGWGISTGGKHHPPGSADIGIPNYVALNP